MSATTVSTSRSRRVDHDRVVGRAQRRDRPAGVDRVAPVERGLARRRPRPRARPRPRRGGGGGPARRRSRSRNTLTVASGNTTVPMSRPFDDAAAVRVDPLPAGARRGSRAPRDAPRRSTPRRSPRARGSRALTSRPSSMRHAVLHGDRALAARSPRTRRRRRARPPPRARPASPRGTSRRCRAPGARARPRPPRATVDFPEPDGPSIATTSVVTRARSGQAREIARRTPGTTTRPPASRAPSIAPSSALAATAIAIAMRWSPWLLNAPASACPPRTTRPSAARFDADPELARAPACSVADAVALLHRRARPRRGSR